MIRLAIDAMGNDQGPRPIVEGVASWVSQDTETTVLLVGNREKVLPLLSTYGIEGHPRVELLHAEQVMEMHDKVSDLREKRDSSIMRLVEAVKEGKAEAMVALGNTAAAVGATTIGLRLLPGIRRPGIAVPMPTQKGVCVVIDMGANTAAKPQHLRDYGVMASIYAEKVLHVANPRVGLLNVGEEEGKGNEMLRESFALLEKAPIRFIGNVEGGDIFNGHCDVVVCDGFVGNVVLKASESLAKTVADWMKEAFRYSLLTKLGALLSRQAFAILKKRISYETYGGAPLLGVNGICIIGHGRSSPLAVFNALRVAKESIVVGLNRLICSQTLDPDAHREEAA